MNKQVVTLDGFSLACQHGESDQNADEAADLAVLEQAEQAYAPMYAVVMHNDDYTTMDFVVAVLMEVFGHALEQAVELMYVIHEFGRAVVAVMPYDIGEMKVIQVTDLAEKMEYPLLTTLEKQ
ncbi:ATP-dependent Clp protease adaptor ClpS [Moraxella oculi]|uniref:ATP-dependent Clp protease adapter protein ClpS n=1 Tax=Moraxella oculi TaxID=2940516 RepID=A0ABW8U327_9GAMM